MKDNNELKVNRLIPDGDGFTTYRFKLDYGNHLLRCKCVYPLGVHSHDNIFISKMFIRSTCLCSKKIELPLN